MPYVKVNDIIIYYEIHGNGESLVLIVGLGTDISEWDGIIRKKDKIVPYTLAEEMHAGIKGSKMLTFAGGHLFLLLRERQQFLDAITEFVGT